MGRRALAVSQLMGAFPVLVTAACVGSSRAVPFIPYSPRLEELRSYLATAALTPEEYVVTKARSHDVVFLGERHYIRENLLLVQRIIPLLYRAGVFTLGTEFARAVDQPFLDSLLSAPQWDEALAREIQFRQNVHWGFREYVDILRAVWELNRTLAPGARPFRVLGLNYVLDWSYFQTAADVDNPELRAKVFGNHTEREWARIILDTIIARGDKIVVHTGLHHAFTVYRQPIVDQGRLFGYSASRMGNVVYERIGPAAFTIALHAPWPDSTGYGGGLVLPADGMIDRALGGAGGRHPGAGFDVVGSPFEHLSAASSVYRFGTRRFRLGDLCDGYIYLGPLPALHGVTPIADFVNQANLARARANSPDPAFRRATIARFLEQAESDAKAIIRDAARVREPRY